MFFLLADASIAAAGDTMPCDANEECAESCIHFAKDVVFVETANDGALLRYKGTIYRLKLDSRRSLRKRQIGADLPGDVELANYKNEHLRIQISNTTRHTSCYVKQADNTFQEVDTDCGGDSDMVLKIFLPDGVREYKAKWDWGC